ncbi:coproporphyrinogen III oxidase [uncultured Clostridium sp.]|uniref:coproporphyrinogen III oxidase n=1 Tax=uncultured Clostridium sp. TaxID=59620 RepID=UPI0026298317|nr:coproporphyrinogen III oxidase [uncultured Clostridium sp.]
MNINLNQLKYRIDVYNMFNIYFPLDEIKFVDKVTEADYIVNINEDEVVFKNKDFIFKEKIYDDIKISLKKCIFISLKTLTGKEYPWGILVGIRPSKIALKFLNEGKREEEIIEILKREKLMREDKSKLCIDVAKSEASFVNKDSKKISIYVGMAFCPTRCVYCSFASNPIGANKNLVEPYLKALKREIKEIKKYINMRNLKIQTVYFGGGTPTAVSNDEFRSLMEDIYKAFIENRDIEEFTVECGRPDSITRDKLMAMKKYNVDRISVNPQTMNDKTLALIGRGHDSQSVIDVFKEAREIGFKDINMDLILGLPGEGLEQVKHTVGEIKKLKPDSVTIHGLSLKRGSTLHENFILKKGLRMQEQDEILDMFLEVENLAKELEIKPYYMYRQKNMVGNMENLGYSKKGKECIYNIQMIEEKQTIIALGADGVSKIIDLKNNKIERFPNVKGVMEYIKRLDEMVERKIKVLDTVYKEG